MNFTRDEAQILIDALATYGRDVECLRTGEQIAEAQRLRKEIISHNFVLEPKLTEVKQDVDGLTRYACHIQWDDNTEGTYSVYELHGFNYVKALDAVVLFGHEEIMLVTRKGETWKTYTR